MVVFGWQLLLKLFSIILYLIKIQLSQNQNGGYRFAIILPTNSHLLNVFNFDELSVLSPAGELVDMHTVP